MEFLSGVQTTIQSTARQCIDSVSKFFQTIPPALENCKKSLSEMVHKTNSVAISVLKMIVSIVLFLSNSSLFVLGALTAALFPQQMRECIERIINVWNGLDFGGKALVISAGAIGWPISLAAFSFLLGAHTSLTLQNQSQASSGSLN
jgi:hypothetical protein